MYYFTRVDLYLEGEEKGVDRGCGEFYFIMTKQFLC